MWWSLLKVIRKIFRPRLWWKLNAISTWWKRIDSNSSLTQLPSILIAIPAKQIKMSFLGFKSFIISTKTFNVLRGTSRNCFYLPSTQFLTKREIESVRVRGVDWEKPWKITSRKFLLIKFYFDALLRFPISST